MVLLVVGCVECQQEAVLFHFLVVSVIDAFMNVDDDPILFKVSFRIPVALFGHGK